MGGIHIDIELYALFDIPVLFLNPVHNSVRDYIVPHYTHYPTFFCCHLLDRYEAQRERRVRIYTRRSLLVRHLGTRTTVDDTAYTRTFDKNKD